LGFRLVREGRRKGRRDGPREDAGGKRKDEKKHVFSD